MKTNYTQLLKTLIVILLNSITVIGLSQDTLVMNNQTKILGKILEVSLTEIKYKKAENISGPAYIEMRSSVFEIRYANGMVEKMGMGVSENTNIRVYTNSGESDKLVAKGSRLMYHDKTLKMSELKKWDIAKNDPKFNSLIVRKDVTSIAYGVSFIGVPITIIGAAVMMDGIFKTIRGDYYEAQQELQNGEIIAAIGAVTLSFNVYCFQSKRHLNKKMAKLYNAQL